MTHLTIPMSTPFVGLKDTWTGPHPHSFQACRPTTSPCPVQYRSKFLFHHFQSVEAHDLQPFVPSVAKTSMLNGTVRSQQSIIRRVKRPHQPILNSVIPPFLPLTPGDRTHLYPVRYEPRPPLSTHTKYLLEPFHATAPGNNQKFEPNQDNLGRGAYKLSFAPGFMCVWRSSTWPFQVEHQHLSELHLFACVCVMLCVL